MNITLEIPDTIAEALTCEGRDPARALLEAFAIEGYRTDRLSEYEVQQLLGFEYIDQLHGFFNEHSVEPHYSIEEFERDVAEARRYRQLQKQRERGENHAG